MDNRSSISNSSVIETYTNSSDVTNMRRKYICMRQKYEQTWAYQTEYVLLVGAADEQVSEDT